MKKITLKSGTWQMDMEMTITVIDEAKFEAECVDINKFWSCADERELTHGSHAKAGLALFAAECFQQMGFNNFKDEKWLEEQFDWSKGKGVEGFPSLDEFGIKIDSIEPWFIDSDQIEIEEKQIEEKQIKEKA